MKKIILFLAFAFALPALVSAQVQEKSIASKVVSGEIWEELGETKLVKNAEKDIEALGILMSEANNPTILLDKRDRIYDVPVPTDGFFKFVYDTTEEVLTKASKRGYYREAGLFLPARYVELPDIPKSVMHQYAYNHAVKSRQTLLDSLKKDPFASQDKVDDQTTRGAYEYRQAILECGGLQACEEEINKTFSENQITEYKNILKVREEWLIYKDKNPVFKFYTLSGDFEDLKFLEKQDYFVLVAFFSGKNFGWDYDYLPEQQFYVNPSPLNKEQSVITGRIIRVYISENLVADILPEDLSIRVYKVK